MKICAKPGCEKPVVGRRSDAKWCSIGCGNVMKARVFAARHPERTRRQWKSYYYTPRGAATALLNNAYDRAKKAGVPMSLTREWVADRLLPMVCEVTGLPLSLKPRGEHRANPFAPSLDRIIPALGYVEGNTRLVCFIFNQARSDFGDDVLMVMVAALAAKRRSVKELTS